MTNPRTLVLGSAIGALAVLALGAAAIGADTQGTLAIVNGIPGKRVDVCLNGSEIKSNLGYGGKVLRNVVGTGSKNLKFYEHDARACRGRQVGQETFTLDPAEDLTIVVTKRAPRVIIFDNSAPLYLGEIPPMGAPYPIDAYVAWRHAADLPVTFRYRLSQPETPIGLTADPVSNKGSEVRDTGGPSFTYQVRATLPNDPDTIAVKRVELAVSRRYEWILVGTNPRNTKFVLLDRAISLPSP